MPELKMMCFTTVNFDDQLVHESCKQKKNTNTEMYWNTCGNRENMFKGI